MNTVHSSTHTLHSINIDAEIDAIKNSRSSMHLLLDLRRFHSVKHSTRLTENMVASASDSTPSLLIKILNI
jgi:predicted amino acid racemase